MAQSRSLLGCLAEHARLRPDSVALIMGAQRVTYAELCAMSLAAFRRIEDLGLPRDARIAVHATKSVRTVALIVACLVARRPFLLPSTELGASSLATLLAQAGCADVLTVESIDGVPGDRVHHIDTTAMDLTVAESGEPRDGSDDDISFLLTTSGSTGLPKVVPLSFGAIDRFTEWAARQFEIGPDTTVLNYAPFNFDLCLLDIRTTLRFGGTTVLVEPERSTNGKYLAELLRTNRVDIVQSVPMLFRLLVDASRDNDSFGTVRHLILTGDKVPPRLLGELPELFGNARLYNIYGCTETNDSFLHEINVATDDAAALPIGRPLPGVDAVVVAEDGSTVLHGPATGELLVSTPFQTTGYLGPGGTAKFVLFDENPRTYFRSGDLVHRDAYGVFTLVGRNDFQVKVRGTRVNLAEIEHVLLDHVRVLEAAVVGVPDDLAGLRIHAVVRGSYPEPLDIMALREHCRLRLPRAALPAAIRVVDDPLPMTSTGKIDRKVIIHELLNRS